MLYSVILKNEEEKMAIKNLNLSSTSRDQRSRFTKYKFMHVVSFTIYQFYLVEFHFCVV